jgi:hypothetical protein
MNTTTLKQLNDTFNSQCVEVRKFNEYRNPKDRKKIPDWKVVMIEPIVAAIEKLLNVKRKDDDLRQFGIRAHVPVTFLKDGKEYMYIDFSNSLETGTLYITDFSAPAKKEYKPGTIGHMNGMNLEQLRFAPEQTIDEVCEFIKTNLVKFRIDEKDVVKL